VSGGGRWSDSKEGAESASGGSSQTTGSWNVDVFVDVVKELVSIFSIISDPRLVLGIGRISQRCFLTECCKWLQNQRSYLVVCISCVIFSC